MDRDEELRILDRALEHLRDKRLPLTDTDTRVSVDRYRSPEWYRAELDRIFTKLPSMLVHSSEIPAPGTFATLEHFGRPLIVSRDQDGVAHVFLNACFYIAEHAWKRTSPASADSSSAVITPGVTTWTAPSPRSRAHTASLASSGENATWSRSRRWRRTGSSG